MLRYPNDLLTDSDCRIVDGQAVVLLPRLVFLPDGLSPRQELGLSDSSDGRSESG